MAGSSLRKILLVDDSIDLRIPMQRMLESEGFEVVCAENGEVALSVLRTARPLPDLILLDLMMPVMDGQTFRSEQMNDPKIANVPVIVLSASSSAKNEVTRMNVHGFLPKPIDFDKLMDLAGKLINQ